MHKKWGFLTERREDNEKRNQKMRICFLDIDGVIQPYHNKFRFDHDMDETVSYLCEKYGTDIYKKMDIYDVCATYYDWSNVAIGYLREFLDATGYYIVIHSSWRKYNDLEKCKALFALYGMEDYVIDLVGIEEKEIAIAKYVETHKNEIENYIVIDDDDYTKFFGRHFLKTCNYLNEKGFSLLLGLTETEVEIEEEENKLFCYHRKEKTLVLKYQFVETEDINVIFAGFDKTREYIIAADYLILINELIRMKCVQGKYSLIITVLRNSNMRDSKELDCINKLGYLTDLTSVNKEGIRHNLAVISVNCYSSLQCSKFLSNNREFLIQQCEMNEFYM